LIKDFLEVFTEGPVVKLLVNTAMEIKLGDGGVLPLSARVDFFNLNSASKQLK
jgi:hypothetical protein